MEKNKRAKKISTGWTIFSYAFLVLFTLITLMPMVWMFYSSFKLNGEILIHPIALPKEPTMANYIKAFEYGNIFNAFSNSLFYSLVSTSLVVLLSLAAGFALTKFGYRSCRIYMALFTLGLLITVNSVITPLFL